MSNSEHGSSELGKPVMAETTVTTVSTRLQVSAGLMVVKGRNNQVGNSLIYVGIKSDSKLTTEAPLTELLMSDSDTSMPKAVADILQGISKEFESLRQIWDRE